MEKDAWDPIISLLYGLCKDDCMEIKKEVFSV